MRRRQALRSAKASRTTKSHPIPRPKYVKPAKAKARDLVKAIRYLRALGLTSSRSKKQRRKIATKFDDVLAGRTIVQKVSPKAAKSYKRQRRRVVNNRLITPKQPKVKYKPDGDLLRQSHRIDHGTILTILTPYSYADLQQGLERLKRDKKIQRLVKSGWKYSLRFFAHDRWIYANAVMATLEQLRDYLENYKFVSQQNDQMLRNLELMVIIVDKNYAMPTQSDRAENRRAAARAWRKSHPDKARKYKEKYYRNWKTRHPAAYEAHVRRMRQYMRKRGNHKPQARFRRKHKK